MSELITKKSNNLESRDILMYLKTSFLQKEQFQSWRGGRLRRSSQPLKFQLIKNHPKSQVDLETTADGKLARAEGPARLSS